MTHPVPFAVGPPETRSHVSGLVVQRVTGPNPRIAQAHTLPLSPSCPVSGNPKAGSDLLIRYRPDGWCLEVYALRKVVRSFEGGFPGVGPYPPERNMEGMIVLITQMCADALGVPVRARADLVLDAGNMEIRARARPA